MGHYRKVYEVIGYAMDGFYCCPECLEDSDGPEEELTPLFLGDAQGDETCDRCTMPLGN